MTLLELEVALNKWWKSTEAERLLLDNQNEVIERVLPKFWRPRGTVTHFKVDPFRPNPAKASIFMEPAMSSYLASIEDTAQRINGQMGDCHGTGSKTA